MRAYERGYERESLDSLIVAAAQTYGFCTPPAKLGKKDFEEVSDAVDADAALLVALCGKIGSVNSTTQVWATAKKSGGTSIVFAVGSYRVAIAQSFVVKAALATAESAGFFNLTVLVSSVGDQESRRRYLRELGNFFKKHAKDLPEDTLNLSIKDPDRAARMLLEAVHPPGGDLSRTVDFLFPPSGEI